jgi:integrase
MNAPRSAKRKGWPPNLYQRPDGYFYYRNPQTKKIKGLQRDKAEAFRKARAANAKLADLSNVDLVAWVAGAEQDTLTAWMDRYLPIWIAEEKPVKATQGTAERYIKRIKQSDFANLLVKDVTTKHCADFLDAIKQDSVALNLRARMLDIFRMAQTKGLIEAGKNPVAATKPRGYEVKRERLSLEQYVAIRAQATGWAANSMDLALLTGQRREDIAIMKFEDVRGGYLHIIQGKTGLKLKQDIRIGLDVVKLTIDGVIRKCRNRVVSKYLVHHTRTSGTYKAGDEVSEDRISDVFTDARKAAGIVAIQEGKTPPTFHEIRSLAERLYKDQYGKEFAQAMLGHKHAKTTAEYDDLRGSGWNVVKAK